MAGVPPTVPEFLWIALHRCKHVRIQRKIQTIILQLIFVYINTAATIKLYRELSGTGCTQSARNHAKTHVCVSTHNVHIYTRANGSWRSGCHCDWFLLPRANPQYPIICHYTPRQLLRSGSRISLCMYVCVCVNRGEIGKLLVIYFSMLKDEMGDVEEEEQDKSKYAERI